jgi:hypothetical protein
MDKSAKALNQTVIPCAALPPMSLVVTLQKK